MKQYLNVSEAATELGTSEAHIRNLVRGIRSATPERYHDSDIIGRGKIAVRFVTLVDFANYGDDLRTAPPYKPLELERELGIGDAQFVNVHDLAVELFRVMVGNIGRITV